MKTYLMAAALGTVALGGIAHAVQTVPPPPPAPPADGECARMMERIDTDGDGRISRAEHDAQSARRFQRMDTNGDGYIDQAERAAMPRPGKHARRGGPPPATPPSPASQTPNGG